VRCGFRGLSSSPILTLVEQHADKLVVHRVDREGNLKQLAEHKVADPRNVSVVAGVGTYYGLHTRTPGGTEIRVYDAGKEEYRVPGNLTRWKGRVIGPGAVLAKGRLFVAYMLPGTPTSPPPHPNPPLLGIIAREGNTVRRLDLVSTPTEAPRVAFSGDGSVAAISLGPRLDSGRVETRTVLYSTINGKERTTIEKFAVSWISHDGRRLIGNKTSAIAVYQDGKCILEKAATGMLRPSANGAYTIRSIAHTSLEVLETKSLKPLLRFTPAPPYELADCALSSDGRLAAYEYEREPSGKTKSRLVIYRLDGTACFTRGFGITDGWALRAPTWSYDGKVFYYLDTQENRLVRLRP